MNNNINIYWLITNKSTNKLIIYPISILNKSCFENKLSNTMSFIVFKLSNIIFSVVPYLSSESIFQLIFKLTFVNRSC